MAMLFEHYSQPVLSLQHWLIRVARSIGLAGTFVAIALGIGICGYHVLGHLSWIDSLVEASMILGGMGAVSPMTNDGVKIFASAYALFSGLLSVSVMAVLIAPWLHRMLHYANQKKQEP